MRTADMRRKLDTIAESMKELQIKGTTRIDWNCLTRKERILFEKINEIKDEYWPNLPPDDVLKENHELFAKGIELIMRRAIDLFQEVTKATCVTSAKDDVFFDLVFTTRIHWFLHEMRRHAEKTRKEEEFLERNERVEDFEKAWKEYEENIAGHTALWSQESFERFIQPLFDRTLRNNGKNGY